MSSLLLYDHPMEEIILWLVEKIGQLGYPGIVVLMFLESTFVPIPSEVVIPPAGYLVSRGDMNMTAVIICGVAGSILGALFNYVLALWLGRPLLMRYGKYMLFPPHRFEKVNAFFLTHGEISTFTGRLIPGIRHFISFPAGLARMKLWHFCGYTALGSAIWVTILAYIGKFVGDNMELVMRYSRQALVCVLVVMTVVFAVYIRQHRKKLVLNNAAPTGENNE